MQFFIRAVINNIKMLAVPSFVFALLMFPVVVFVLSFLGGGAIGQIKVGLIYEEAPVTVRIINRFYDYVAEDGEFILFSDREEMEEAVASRQIECGYEIDKDLGITLYKGPLSAAHEVFNLMLSSALIETLSGELGAEVLKVYFPEEPRLAEDIQAGADIYAEKGPAMKMETIIIGEAGERQEDGINHQLHGLTALFAYLLAMLCAVFWKQNDIFVKLRIAGESRILLYLLSQITVTFLFLLIFFAVSLRAEVMGNIGITLVFCLALACFALFLSVYMKRDGVALIPFLFVIGACFGQTLFNIGETAAFLEPFTALVITRYYMEGIMKGVPWLEGGVLGLAALLAAAASYGKVKME